MPDDIKESGRDIPWSQAELFYFTYQNEIMKPLIRSIAADDYVTALRCAKNWFSYMDFQFSDAEKAGINSKIVDAERLLNIPVNNQKTRLLFENVLYPRIRKTVHEIMSTCNKKMDLTKMHFSYKKYPDGLAQLKKRLHIEDGAKT
jgi:hypothetical protein